MTLQSRLADLVGAIGADVKDLDDRVSDVETNSVIDTLTARSSTSTAGSSGANVPYTSASITLPPGKWLVRAKIAGSTNAADAISCGIYNQTTAAEVSNSRGPADTCPTSGYTTDVESSDVVMEVASNTQICPLGCRNGGTVLTIAGGAASGIGGQITAFRLANLEPAGVVPVVTSLPSSPVDGEEVYYLVDPTNLITWHMKYKSSDAVWMFLGGPPLAVERVGGYTYGTHESTNATGLATLTTPVSITCPRTGMYDISGSVMCRQQIAGNLAGFTLFVTGDTGGWNTLDASFISGVNDGVASLFYQRRRAVANGVAISHRYSTSNATSAASFWNRNLWVKPVYLE